MAERKRGVQVRRGVSRGLAQELTAEGAALCGGTSAMPISGGARHNVNYTHEAALRWVGERRKRPGAVRIIPSHYVE
ncbi:hypothetical protein ABLB84_20200 [Xenorhabdus szentirmaii]|uniref:hypothetical protein n=1 Tax=Xenorhabdus szentirmaii TaxID=290112 RepID=UPI0019C664E2|nr:hypothetical protein [Xenorhabdus sp. ZM]MBD2806546.1 hypothetical protein [Xenorhabdus sp. ZM]